MNSNHKQVPLSSWFEPLDFNTYFSLAYVVSVYKLARFRVLSISVHFSTQYYTWKKTWKLEYVLNFMSKAQKGKAFNF